MQDYILMDVDCVKQSLIEKGYEVIIKSNSFSLTKDKELVTNVVIKDNVATIVTSNFKL